MDCLPAWHYQILEAAAATRTVGQIKMAGCPQSLGDRDTVPCQPEKMRANAEAQLHARGLWTGALTLTQYALARNISSEVGPDATPEEMVAVVEAAVNRQRYQPDKWAKIEDQLLHHDSEGAWFGKQRGQNPAASTSQDPYFVHFVVANLVLSGATDNFTKGANVYIDAVTQDAVRRQCLAAGKKAPADCPTAARTVVTNWTAGGESYWVGALPGINPRRMMLMVSGRPARTAYKTADGKARWSTMRAAAFAALDSAGPDERKTVYDLPPCEGAGPKGATFRNTAGMLAAVMGVFGTAIAGAYFARAWRLSKPIPIRARV